MLDRRSLALPAAQTMMLKRVIDDCQAAGKPVIVVLVNGAKAGRGLWLPTFPR